jgi:hypothetical protein
MLLLGLTLLAGCGYRAGSLIPSDVHTIAVDVFDNQTFRRGIEIGLTEAVQREIRRRTPLKTVDKSRADSVMTGNIVDVTQSVHVKDPKEQVVTEDITIFVNFRWTDRRTGRIIAQGNRISYPIRIYAPLGENIASGTEESTRHLAEQIVDRMEGGW